MKRVLLVGCGDVAQRLIPLLASRYRLYGLTRQDGSGLRAAGVTPLCGDLDRRASLSRLAGLADAVIHLAPPPTTGSSDLRTRHLLAVLGQGQSLPQCLIYVSTSGVYGDQGGGIVVETTPPRPTNPRAQRRIDAEQQLRAWGRRTGVRVVILRVPGIYAADRLPLERLRAGTPAIVAPEDSYTNHIHADDLAALLRAALLRGRAQRVYHACDGADLTMGDYFDQVADAFRLPRPPRLPRAEVQQLVSPMLWSFMRESRRLRAPRLAELRVRLRYPDVASFLRSIRDAAGRSARIS